MLVDAQNSSLRDVIDSLADPLGELITQLGLLGGENSWQVPWLANLGQDLGLGFLPSPLADDASMLAGLALVAELPEMTFANSVLPDGLAGLADAASPLSPEGDRDPADLHPGAHARPPGYGAIEAAAGQAGLFYWPIGPGGGPGTATNSIFTFNAGPLPYQDPTGLPAVALAGIVDLFPSPAGTARFGGEWGMAGAAVGLGSLFDFPPRNVVGIDGASGNAMAPPAMPGSLDALLSSMLPPVVGQEDRSPSVDAGPAASTMWWPEPSPALPETITAAALAGSPMPAGFGDAVSPLLPFLAEAQAPWGLVGSRGPTATGPGDLPYASIAHGFLAQGSPGPLAPGRDPEISNLAFSPASQPSPAGPSPSAAAAAPPPWSFPSLAMPLPGDDGLYAGGLTADALARLLPSAGGGAGVAEGGAGRTQVLSTLEGLLAPPLRPAAASPRSVEGGPWASAPGGNQAGVSADAAAGQGRGSAPPRLFLNNRQVERVVLSYVNRASARPAGSRQQPNPKTLKRPGSSTAAS